MVPCRFPLQRIIEMESQKNHELLDKLRERVATNTDYVPVSVDDARESIVNRGQKTVELLRAGKVRPYHPAPMARQLRKTEKICVKLGYGDNNAYLPNSVHTASQVLKYDTAEEAAHDIETIIIPLAQAGEFDASLSKVLENHKAASKRRVAKAEKNKAAFAEPTPIALVAAAE